MDNKHKAAELVLEFLPIVGQDPYTGIDIAKKCGKAAAKLFMKTEIDMQREEILDNSYDWDEVIKFIDTF